MARRRRAAELPRREMLIEKGYSGLKLTTGQVWEDFDRSLRGMQAARVYEEMRRNDPVLGAVINAIELVLRGVRWMATPASEEREAEDEAKFITSCMDDMSHSWRDFITEILTMIPFGWAYFEVVYKERKGEGADSPSGYDDGRLGWRKVALRGQESLDRWDMDEHGGIRGMIQRPNVYGGSTLSSINIPIEKAVLFRTKREKNNPEGYALALDTPIPVPMGWTTMRALKEGDKVFDEKGKVRYVTWKSPVWESRPCYRITFSGKDSIVADERHQWSVTTSNDRHRGKAPRLMSTKDIYEWSLSHGQKSGAILSFGQTPPIDGLSSFLPIKPYVLGYWLGDGTRASNEITVSAVDRDPLVANLRKEGYEATVGLHHHPGTFRVRPLGLTQELRRTGLINNKHIPECYLRANFEDRLALLQGLMDSDGSAPAGDHKPLKWVNANKGLFDQVCELVRSLGGRPLVSVSSPPKDNRRPIAQRLPHYTASFSLVSSAFRLERKLVNQTNGTQRPYEHYLKAIELVAPLDTACIEVDSPSHLFLAGPGMVPTHNSFFRNAVRPYTIKKGLEDIETIGYNRDMTGIPVVYMPKGASDDDYSKAQDIVERIQVDEQAGLVFEWEGEAEHQNWKFSLVSAPGGSKAADLNNAIGRVSGEIGMVFLAQFLRQGQQRVGSYAMVKEFKDLFHLALSSILDNIEDTMNRFLIHPLLRLNGVSRELWPHIIHDPVAEADTARLAAFVSSLAQAGMLTYSRELENSLRRQGDLPEIVEEETGEAGSEALRWAREYMSRRGDEA